LGKRTKKRKEGLGVGVGDRMGVLGVIFGTEEKVRDNEFFFKKHVRRNEGKGERRVNG